MLLEVRLAARRADTAEVIAAAIEAKTALGWGHRRIAAGCGRPVSTVRGWLRAFGASAASIGERFTGLLLRDAPDAVVLWPKPADTARGEALSALMAYAEGLARRFVATATVTWVQVGIAQTNGRLFCRSWWAAGPNTNWPLCRPWWARGQWQERLPYPCDGRVHCLRGLFMPELPPALLPSFAAGFPCGARRRVARPAAGFGGAPRPDGEDRPVSIPPHPGCGR